MNITELPAQIVVSVEEIETDGVSIGFTIIVIPDAVAEVGEAQDSELVISTVIISLFCKLLDVTLAEFVPIIFPFFFHI